MIIQGFSMKDPKRGEGDGVENRQFCNALWEVAGQPFQSSKAWSAIMLSLLLVDALLPLNNFGIDPCLDQGWSFLTTKLSSFLNHVPIIPSKAWSVTTGRCENQQIDMLSSYSVPKKPLMISCSDGGQLQLDRRRKPRWQDREDYEGNRNHKKQCAELATALN